VLSIPFFLALPGRLINKNYGFAKAKKLKWQVDQEN
jgi:hypothetical protein